MAIQIRVKDEFEALRQDANKVVQEIGKLSAHLKDAGMEQAAEVGNDVSRAARAQIADMRRRLSEANKAIATYKTKVDTEVRRSPYAYISGALGVGYLLGKFLPTNTTVKHSPASR